MAARDVFGTWRRWRASPHLADGAPARVAAAMALAPLATGLLAGAAALLILSLHVNRYPLPAQDPWAESWSLMLSTWIMLTPLSLLIGGPLVAFLRLRDWRSPSLYLFAGLLVGAAGAMIQQLSSGLSLGHEWAAFLGLGAAMMLLARRLAGVRALAAES